MKKLFIALLIAAALLAVGAFALAEADTTLLVYMCGADLQNAACVDLHEMAEANTGKNTNVVVMAGGSRTWSDRDLTGGTRNLVVISDGAYASVENLGQTSMGSPDSLLEFMQYGLTKYPAKRTVFILWNHGGGPEGGICFDEIENDDGLTMSEIRDVLDALDRSVPGWHIDVFGCDACMMASYEMAALLADHSIDYFIASEEVEPGVGWFYTPWLMKLDQTPDISGEALCKLIVDNFMQDNRTFSRDEPFQLSAVDLIRFRLLKTRMEGLAATLNAALEDGQLASLRRSRSRLYTFGSFCAGSWDMVDMAAAVEAFAFVDPAAASEVLRMLDNCVVYNSQTANLLPCSGLALLIPEDSPEDYLDCRPGMDLTHCLPNWMAFLDNYVGLITGSNYDFSDLTPVQVSVGETVTGAYSDEWNITWLTTEEEYGVNVTVSEGEYGFSIQLDQQDLENLDYVEGKMLLDMSDDKWDCFVDLGVTRNNLIDWTNGTVTSLFDGSWPVFGDQLVPLYDQSRTENSRRSLIPVKLNGERTYLVVVFPENSSEGRVIGANAGYDENGLPIRETTTLSEGDEIVPVYTMYIGEADSDEDYDEDEFDGDPIIWHEGMTVTYVSLAGELDDEDEPVIMQFCFVVNDIFGDYTMSEFTEFTL